jgi:hypothetical protein
MGKLYAQLDDDLRQFIAEQHVFFVGTAPLSPEGHVNVSPKGLDTFRVLGPRTVAYLDLTGSGIETVAHVRENGRVTLMFCAFQGMPRILRLYGRARAIEPGDVEWARLAEEFPPHLGRRCVVLVDLARIADSCGFGVPLYEFKGGRTQLAQYAERKGPAELERYKGQKNRESIDGLPGLRGHPAQ